MILRANGILPQPDYQSSLYTFLVFKEIYQEGGRTGHHVIHPCEKALKLRWRVCGLAVEIPYELRSKNADLEAPVPASSTLTE